MPNSQPNMENADIDSSWLRAISAAPPYVESSNVFKPMVIPKGILKNGIKKAKNGHSVRFYLINEQEFQAYGSFQENTNPNNFSTTNTVHGSEHEKMKQNSGGDSDDFGHDDWERYFANQPSQLVWSDIMKLKPMYTP